MHVTSLIYSSTLYAIPLPTIFGVECLQTDNRTQLSLIVPAVEALQDYRCVFTFTSPSIALSSGFMGVGGCFRRVLRKGMWSTIVRNTYNKISNTINPIEGPSVKRARNNARRIAIHLNHSHITRKVKSIERMDKYYDERENRRWRGKKRG